MIKWGTELDTLQCYKQHIEDERAKEDAADKLQNYLEVEEKIRVFTSYHTHDITWFDL